MTRRVFLRIGTLGTAALALGQRVWAQARPSIPPLTIAQLVAASFDGVRTYRLDHERKDAPALWALRQSGKLRARDLGTSVCEILDAGEGQFIERLHDVSEVRTSVVWSHEDEMLNPAERDKVNFVLRLLTNAFDAHASQLVQAVGPHRAVISRGYQFQSSGVEQIAGGYVMHIYSALSVLDPATAYFERTR